MTPSRRSSQNRAVMEEATNLVALVPEADDALAASN